MKPFAIIFCWLIAPSAFATAADRLALTVRSVTGQFIVRGAVVPPVSRSAIAGTSANAELIELDPNILAVTCERIKQALLRDLAMGDVWRGRIYVEITSTMSTNEPPRIYAKPYTDGWQYQMELPRWIDKSKLLRGVVQGLLLEMANRRAGLRSAEIPLWLSEGLSQELMNSAEVDLALPQPQWNFNHVNVALQMRQAIRRDPLKESRERLLTHAALSFTRLGDALPDPAPEETWKTFQASAQLFVHELLRTHVGRAGVVEMVYELPFYLNWQSAFLNAFRGEFPRLLDVEKWWAVVLVNFTGHDPMNAWTIPVALQHLDETLHPPVLVSNNPKELPHRVKLKTQQIIGEWEYMRQRIVLNNIAGQLFSLRFRTPPELIALVDAYRAVISDYVDRRDKSGMMPVLPGLPALRVDLLVRDVVKKLDGLDAQRSALSATNSPPATVSAGLAK